ncbi:hypothetical protein LX16_4394 [Stackebrandtia albiflava]|uniref:Uncharacterized protein n=1 Tax=Stackebrandtia albiflava TaxID=406432 RepID=A0A562URD1_9ACTN|nr:DUF6010 family protein [Stackebrandtia albiflava]TWJ08173.1 hypothetical protein LX16_4394 [Stackebrandtia albiflava]
MSTHPHSPPTGLGRILRWWPIPAAVVLAVFALGLPFPGAEPGPLVTRLGQILVILPFIYLLTAKIGRPAATWPVLFASTAVVVALQFVDESAPAIGFGVLTLAVLAWSVADGDWRSRGFRIQATGMALFGAFAVGWLFTAPETAVYLIAAGWFLHAFWDLAHLRRGAPVARSYAEWCAVVDLLIGVGVVLVLR